MIACQNLNRLRHRIMNQRFPVANTEIAPKRDYLSSANVVPKVGDNSAFVVLAMTTFYAPAMGQTAGRTISILGISHRVAGEAHGY